MCHYRYSIQNKTFELVQHDDKNDEVQRDASLKQDDLDRIDMKDEAGQGKELDAVKNEDQVRI